MQGVLACMSGITEARHLCTRAKGELPLRMRACNWCKPRASHGLCCLRAAPIVRAHVLHARGCRQAAG